MSNFGNGYAVPEEEASRIRLKGVKEGTATIKATITYNGKSQTLESTVQVGDNRQVDTTELQQLLDEVKHA